MEQKWVDLVVGGQNIRATGLYHNSKEVLPGGLFFALKNNQYVAEAIAHGAIAIVSEIDVDVPATVTHLVVDDVRAEMALVAQQFYGNVATKMRLTAVVGTNGKTTTTYIVKHLLEVATGKNVGLIGTTGIQGAGDAWNGVTTLTTPDPIDLHRALASMYQNGVRDVAMEVSAHAIYYRKIAGLNFQAVIFTNISQDHLDFFRSYEHYQKTKISFFQNLTSGTVIINADDPSAGQVASAVTSKENVHAISYSLKKDAVVGTSEWAFVDRVKLSPDGSDFELSKIGKCHLALPGLFNVYNAVGASLAVNALGVTWEQIKEGLKTLPEVPGRFNCYAVHGVTAIIDYAHTPDGLEKLLTCARTLLPNAQAKLWVVFGCGGDRDRTKRPKMGAIAARYADRIVLTNDNPRTENPEAIIDAIERGVKTASPKHLIASLEESNTMCVRITDRTKAINYAIEQATIGDIVVIAGKGHENYLDINGQKIPYMDRKVLDNILRG